MYAGNIVIRPRPEKIGPNSVNLRLHEELLVYTEPELDMKKDNPTRRITIPKEGLVLQPGELYLGRTVEFTHTKNLVPILDGRSSIGMLGIEVHISAGLGDVGFEGFWTLEITVVKPTRVYAGVEVCQISYHPVEGAVDEEYKGKYNNNLDVQASRLWQELKE
jgi:dCTP deaminase